MNIYEKTECCYYELVCPFSFYRPFVLFTKSQPHFIQTCQQEIYAVNAAYTDTQSHIFLYISYNFPKGSQIFLFTLITGQNRRFLKYFHQWLFFQIKKYAKNRFSYGNVPSTA